MVSVVPNPHAGATASMGSALSSRRAGGLDAHALDVAGRRLADLGAEAAGEMARAHGHALGHRLDREVALRVVEHPLLQVADGVALGELGGELGRELGLAAGAAQEEHEPAGHAERDSTAEVLLDDGQGEVHARRHAGRGPQVAVARCRWARGRRRWRG